MQDFIQSIDFNSIIAAIISAVIIPLIVTCGKKLVAFLDAKETEAVLSTNNNELKEALKILFDFTETAVISVNQTIVDSLKNMEKFDEESQKKAFETAKNTIINSLTKQTLSTLELGIDNFDNYLDALIHAYVNKHKNDRINTTLIETISE